MHRATHVLLLLVIIGITSSLTSGAIQPHQHPHGDGCFPDERAALLSFRKGITNDSTNLLASWRGQDCCRWRGIKCSNRTGHIVNLHLRNPIAIPDTYGYYDPCQDANALFGEISPSLFSLKHLEHMDLSMNCLPGPNSQIPHLLGSMGNLRYLNLSGIPFTGRVPPQLGNLSKLQYLDIAQFPNARGVSDMYSPDVTWLANQPKLKYLGMSRINLSGRADWPHTLNMLPSLRVIRLASCSLDTANQSLPHFNLTKLETLDLSFNSLHHPIGSTWFWKATSIKYLDLTCNMLLGQLPNALEKFTNLNTLDLYGNNLTGSIPCGIGALTNLHYLVLSSNNFCGSIPSEIGALTNLVYLELSYNNFSGSVPSEIGALTNLAYLHLSSNNFSGSLPSEIGSLTNLASLDLGYNKFSGSVPSEISGLTNLTYLILRNNNFSGLITEKNLESLQSLRGIDLSSNNLKVVVDSDWNHPFNLDYAAFAHCQMGPTFPAWLERQPEIIQLNISNTGLKDKIPDWFWSTVSSVEYLDISYNQISGSLPADLHDMAFNLLNLRSNQFTGPLPRLPRYLTILDISSNAFSGTLPSFLEASEQLFSLLMSSNKFGGEIPESLCKLVNLGYLDFSNNILEGKIPQCFEVESMTHLLLSNNSLSGTFPAFLKKCTDLEFLDLSWNKFHGRLPSWIGELGGLHILRLGHNVFSGFDSKS